MTLTGSEQVHSVSSPATDENSRYVPFQLPLELIKNEVVLTLIQFCDLTKKASLHEIAESSLGFDTKNLTLCSAHGGNNGVYLKKFACQVEYIRSFLSVIKLLPTCIVAEIGWKLVRDCEKLLKAAFSEVEKASLTEDRNLPGQLTQGLILPLVQLTHDCLELNSFVIIDKQLLSSETVIDGYGVNRTEEIVRDAHKYSQRIFGDAITFLVRPASISQEKSNYLRVLALCQKLWKFHESLKDLCAGAGSKLADEIQTIEEFLGANMCSMLCSENGRSFVKFWYETIFAGKEGDGDLPDSLVKGISGEDFPQVYMVFTMFLNEAWFWKTEPGKLLTPVIIRGLTNDLLCEKLETRKRAAFVLETITSLYSNGTPIFDSSIPEVVCISLNNMDVQKYRRFWMYFFDLYNILNETQIHIIQPVLPKLNIFHEYSNHEAIFSWLPILLTKMVGHDNRSVVKEGLERFIQTGKYFETQSTNKYRQLAEDFLENRVMILVKDHVGWVLNEPEDFFKDIVTFGKFLTQIYSDRSFPHFVAAEKILTFLTFSGKCMGPHAVFFFVSVLDEVFSSIDHKITGKEISSDTNTRFESCMTLLALVMSNSFTTLSKYFRDLLETRCTNILLNMMPSVRMFQPVKLDSQLFFKLLAFLGSISDRVFPKLDVQASLCQVVKTLEDDNGADIYKDLLTGCELHTFASTKLSSTSILGLFRFLIIYAKLDLERNLHRVHSSIANFSEQMLREELLQGSIQGLKELYQTYPPENTKDVYIKFAENVYNKLSAVTEFTFQDFMVGVRSLEVLSAVPDILTDILQPTTLISKNDPLRLFLLRKIYSIQAIDEIRQLHVLNEFNKYDLENVVGPSELSRMYQVSTERNIFAEFYQLKFEVYTKIVDTLPDLDFGSRMLILETTLDSLEKCDQKGVAAGLRLAKCVAKGLDYNLNGEFSAVLNNIASFGWSMVFEHRKTEAFWCGMNAFVEYIACPYFLQNKELMKFAELIFEHGETVCGLSLVFIKQLTSVDIPDNLLDEAHKIFINAALFGAPLTKNYRATFAMWDYLTNSDRTKNPDLENFTSDCQTRILACEKMRQNISRLLSREDSKHLGESLLYYIVTTLLQRNDEESITRMRYFSGSFTHRLKQRIYQILLVLQPLFNYEISKIALRKTMHSLATDSPQPSVRYMGEWLIALILERQPKLYPIFFSLLERGVQIRIGFGAFFATICLHVAKLVGSPEFYDKALQALTVLTLSQHVTVRIYAQVAFQKIFERAQECQFESIVNKYEVVLVALKGALVNVSGNCGKLLETLNQDFYVNAFDCKTHYCYEVIFGLLPRMSGIIKDECSLQPVIIRQLQLDLQSEETQSEEHINALENTYLEYEKSVWHLKTVVADGRELGEEHSIQNIICNTTNSAQSEQTKEEETNYQKKINPWKLLSVSEEIEEFANYGSKKKCVSEDGLVVVASLLDHMPNLGGLCRTCEIFGVHKYVINSLKILNDQTFQTLSVSAQNWVNVLEVPARELQSFLLTYSARGYTIFGVEQANESSPLSNISFPPKSVLLLGNEKHGIPSDLLHLVDKCIEIPQVGIIRSLNVHVTGALCIYNYSAQHVL